MTDSTRAEYIKGLRALADLLADHDDLTLPYYGQRLREQTLYVEGSSAVAQALLYIQAMDETPAMKFEWQSDRLTWLAITGRMGGLHVQLRLRAQETCEQRVSGAYKASDGSMHEIKEWAIPAELRPDDAHGPGHNCADCSERDYLDEVERSTSAEIAEVLGPPSGRYPELMLGSEL